MAHMVFSFRLKQFFSSQEFLSLVYMTHSGGGELVLPFLCQSKLHLWNLFSRLLILLNLHVCRELRSRIIQMQTIYGWHLEVNRGCLFGLSFQKTDIWWVVCIAICCNVRKGLRKEIAGTYLNLALYFCVFSKYLRNRISLHTGMVHPWTIETPAG